MSSESDKEFRILIVDDQREVARVLRTSLELMERDYKIVDVPSGEEAILEAPRQPFDLVVADYRLPGMSGIDLIKRMRKKNKDLKSIVISAYDLDEVSDKIKELKVLKVLKKPIDMDDFAAVVQEALHGKAKIHRGETLSDKIGPIPTIDEGPISLVLGAMRADLGANATILVDRKGRVVQQHGTIGEDLRFSELSVLLAANFTTTGEISTYLGDDPPTALHFYDGGNYDIYSLALGLHYFITIVFPAGSERQMGAVVRFGTRAATELAPMVGGEDAAPIDKAKEKEEIKKPKKEAKAEKAEKPKSEDVVEEEEEDEEEEIEITAPESIDLDALETALAEADDDVDSFWDTATDVELPTIGSGKSLTLEEAKELGLMPNDGKD